MTLAILRVRQQHTHLVTMTVLTVQPSDWLCIGLGSVEFDMNCSLMTVDILFNYGAGIEDNLTSFGGCGKNGEWSLLCHVQLIGSSAYYTEKASSDPWNYS